MYKSILLILLSIIIAVTGQVCLKVGMNQISKLSSVNFGSLMVFLKKIVGSPLVVLGLFLYGLSALVWLVVLSRVDLSFAYPMIGLSYVLVLVISSLFLKEQVGLIRWLGAAIIILGVILISRT